MSSVEPEKTTGKPTRVLACVLCKQRRVKCSRSFPCTNCIRAGVQCTQPAVHKRRRRFAERGLLERLQHYEYLLQQNNIKFEPLHGSPSASAAATPHDDHDDAHPARGSKDKEAIDVWQSIKRVTKALDDDDDDGSDGNSSSYDHADDNVKLAVQAHDHLLFGAPNPDVHLPSLHPDQVQIFRLWQIYLDNVNTLLKVTHTPTLQKRIIDAAADVENISEALEALMFSIYCAAVLSLTDDECIVSFHLSRDHLLARYQVASLYLYLVSVGPQVDPRSLACMVTVAIRIAQRMGMHTESSYNAPGCSALEAEMRRRLWWSLVLFDHRICEIVGQEKSTSLSPTWDCRPPLNVNDFEIRADMKKPPPARHDTSATEALFAVVRSELADFVRHSPSHLAIIGGNPSADVIAQSNRSEGGELKALETAVEDKYLAHCNPEVPLHFMTIWTTRSFFARSRLMEHYLTHAASAPEQLTGAQRSKALSYALRMLECDTQLRTSPLTSGYLWLVEVLYSPVLAYFHILNGLAKRPGGELADKAWKAVCDNYEALINGPKHHRTRLMFALKFSRVTLQTWEARQTLARQQNSPPEPPPRFVLDAMMRASQMRSSGEPPSVQSSSPREQSVGLTPSLSLSVASGTSPMSLLFPPPLDLGGLGAPGKGQHFGVSTPAGVFLDTSGQASMDMGVDQFWSDETFKWV
ncbi:hypothetical protein C7999DRAFT_31281 [Corynascus novoguineensis]|uniref:Zn(2)-C6 fungal-type domain-containing protein n=1 Tax=Corynascus novoguineensis TaxID=1126955 RepID=A0AAN7CVX3_9PEZI|nr:hypothetical protein C7999DRAFT_31281 [Corynascus novoguineensis]